MYRRLTTGALAVAVVILLASPALATGEFEWGTSGYVTSTYYDQRDYGTHGGVDVANSQWTPICASRSGTVSFAGWSTVGYGNLVILDHELSYSTRYAHMVSIGVTTGQTVARGEVIGWMGTTGNSTGPHLHFEIRQYGYTKYFQATMWAWIDQGDPVNYTDNNLPPDNGGTPPPPPPDGANIDVVDAAGVRCTVSGLNVREGPSTAYAILGQMALGQQYVSIETNANGWHRVYFDGREGWASGYYLADMGQVTAIECAVQELDVRSGPGTSYSLEGSITLGQQYVSITFDGDWHKIFWGGEEYWVDGGEEGGTPPPPPPPPDPSDVLEDVTVNAVECWASALTVRSGPSSGYSIIGYVTNGQRYAKTGSQNGYDAFPFDGRTGWASSYYLNDVSGVAAVKVLVDSLDVRTGPGTGYSVAGQARKDETYVKIAMQDTWVKIYYGGYERWVDSGEEAPPPPPPPPPPAGEQVIEVNAGTTLNVRSGPGSGYAILGTIKAGQRYVSVETDGSWHKIYFKGNEGWCHGGYVATVTGFTVVECTVSGLNVRSGPGTGYAIQGQIHAPEKYVRVTTSGDWYKIYWGGGEYWVYGPGYTTTYGL